VERDHDRVRLFTRNGHNWPSLWSIRRAAIKPNLFRRLRR
jgi:hypothetical protein